MFFPRFCCMFTPDRQLNWLNCRFPAGIFGCTAISSMGLSNSMLDQRLCCVPLFGKPCVINSKVPFQKSFPMSELVWFDVLWVFPLLQLYWHAFHTFPHPLLLGSSIALLWHRLRLKTSYYCNSTTYYLYNTYIYIYLYLYSYMILYVCVYMFVCVSIPCYSCTVYSLALTFIYQPQYIQSR